MGSAKNSICVNSRDRHVLVDFGFKRDRRHATNDQAKNEDPKQNADVTFQSYRGERHKLLLQCLGRLLLVGSVSAGASPQPIIPVNLQFTKPASYCGK